MTTIGNNRSFLSKPIIDGTNYSLYRSNQIYFRTINEEGWNPTTGTSEWARERDMASLIEDSGICWYNWDTSRE